MHLLVLKVVLAIEFVKSELKLILPNLWFQKKI